LNRGLSLARLVEPEPGTRSRASTVNRRPGRCVEIEEPVSVRAPPTPAPPEATDFEEAASRWLLLRDQIPAGYDLFQAQILVLGRVTHPVLLLPLRVVAGES
jgi:hypothetical protein